jgi:hypothetical protein
MVLLQLLLRPPLLLGWRTPIFGQIDDADLTFIFIFNEQYSVISEIMVMPQMERN